MGRHREHAVVVSSKYGARAITDAHTRAVEIFGSRMVTPMARGVVNDCYSFLVGPDGSKEGWEDSDQGDRDRAKFVEYLETTDLDWVEIQFGDDDGVTKVISDSDEKYRNGGLEGYWG